MIEGVRPRVSTEPVLDPSSFSVFQRLSLPGGSNWLVRHSPCNRYVTDREALADSGARGVRLRHTGLFSGDSVSVYDPSVRAG